MKLLLVLSVIVAAVAAIPVEDSLVRTTSDRCKPCKRDSDCWGEFICMYDPYCLRRVCSHRPFPDETNQAMAIDAAPVEEMSAEDLMVNGFN